MKEGEAVAFTGFPIGNVLGFHAVTDRAIIASITPVVIPTANAQQLDAKVIRRVQAGSFNVFQLDAIAYPGKQRQSGLRRRTRGGAGDYQHGVRQGDSRKRR